MSGDGPVLAFDTDDVEFVRGVQVGIIYQRLAAGERDFDAVIYTGNIEMAMRLAESAGCQVRSVSTDDEWTQVEFYP